MISHTDSDDIGSARLPTYSGSVGRIRNGVCVEAYLTSSHPRGRRRVRFGAKKPG